MKKKQMNDVIDEISQEIDHEVRTYGEMLKGGLSDPNQMLSIDEIEMALKAVQKSTNDLYSKMTGEILDKINEKELIKLKKANTEPKE